MILGCSTNMNIPCVDGDWMGRAYPLGSQITPVVYESGLLFLPSAISDGNGNAMVCPINTFIQHNPRDLSRLCLMLGQRR